MTISTIDPATPDPNAVAGLGDDELRALKAALVNQFQGQVGDLYDIPVTAGPRSLNAVDTKADQADVDAIAADVATLQTNDGTQDTTLANHEGRITALEGSSIDLATALNAAWPVGSLFVSADGGTPTAKGLPGTWSVAGDGRFLLGGTPVGSTGGANSRTLTEANLPPHKHTHTTHRHQSGVSGTLPAYAYTSPPQALSTQRGGTNSPNSEYAEFNTDEGAGTAAAVDTTPAFLRVRFYQRTA